MYTSEGIVGVLISLKRWQKAQAQVRESKEMTGSESGLVDKARLESIRGFWLYVSRTFPSITLMDGDQTKTQMVGNHPRLSAIILKMRDLGKQWRGMFNLYKYGVALR